MSGGWESSTSREGYKGLGSLSRVAVLDLFPCQIKRSKKNRRGGELHTDKNRQLLGACDKEERRTIEHLSFEIFVK